MSSSDFTRRDASAEVDSAKGSIGSLQVAVGENVIVDDRKVLGGSGAQTGGHADLQPPHNGRRGFIEVATEDSVTDSDLRKISIEMDRIKSAKAEGRLLICFLISWSVISY